MVCTYLDAQKFHSGDYMYNKIDAKMKSCEKSNCSVDAMKILSGSLLVGYDMSHSWHANLWWNANMFCWQWCFTMNAITLYMWLCTRVWLYMYCNLIKTPNSTQRKVPLVCYEWKLLSKQGYHAEPSWVERPKCTFLLRWEIQWSFLLDPWAIILS